jgi:hypothetical protein
MDREGMTTRDREGRRSEKVKGNRMGAWGHGPGYRVSIESKMIIEPGNYHGGKS